MTAKRNVRLFTFEWKGRKSFYNFSTKNKTQPGTWWVDLSALRLVFMYTRMSKQLLICNLFFLKILFFYFCTNKQSIKIYFVQIIRLDKMRTEFIFNGISIALSTGEGGGLDNYSLFCTLHFNWFVCTSMSGVIKCY